MNPSSLLERLADKTAYLPGRVSVRWGQLLRSNASVSDELARLAAGERMAVLGSMGHLHSGVVPRANAYFIVRELPFDKIPARMHVTRADMRRIAVVVDGMDFVCRIEREFLKPILKGPDSLESAFSVRRSDLRLFDVRESKAELMKRAATGALTYLKRGETVSYNKSGDPLKGGIPAKRSQVKNRKPYWYTVISEEPVAAERIVLPEHHDKRFVFTKVGSDDVSVIIDTLYSFTPNSDDDAAFIHAGLNSLLGWYQVELRGRSQHGDGVLKVKLPDYRGILLANPQTVSVADKEVVLEAFAALKGAGTGPSLDELGTPERLAFDVAYLRACGFEDAEDKLLILEQELRALAGERVERRLSVSDAKVSRRKATDVTASVEAYATKVAALVLPYPDPRSYVIAGEAVTSIRILARPDGPLSVGAGLFDAGEVSDGSTMVAKAADVVGATIIKAVLTLDPDVKQVDLPVGPRLQQVYTDWQSSVTAWHSEFEKAAERTLIGVTDVRTRQAVINSALIFLHAK